MIGLAGALGGAMTWRRVLVAAGVLIALIAAAWSAWEWRLAAERAAAVEQVHAEQQQQTLDAITDVIEVQDEVEFQSDEWVYACVFRTGDCAASAGGARRLRTLE